MIKKTVNTNHNPQPNSPAPIDLPKDQLSQQLWIQLHYISPIIRLIIIKMVNEDLSSSLIFHWYRYRQKLNLYETFIAIRPILNRPNNHFVKNKYQETSLLEFKTKDPIVINDYCYSLLQLSTSTTQKNKSC